MLRVVAVLVNTQTSEVAQAEKAQVGASTDIRSLAVDPREVGVRYYDLSGRAVTSLGQGIYIQATTNPDGSVTTTKVVRR